MKTDGLMVNQCGSQPGNTTSVVLDHIHDLLLSQRSSINCLLEMVEVPRNEIAGEGKSAAPFTLNEKLEDIAQIICDNIQLLDNRLHSALSRLGGEKLI